jgi:hypothetical protein
MNPFTIDQAEELRWCIEDFARLEPFQKNKCEASLLQLQKYRSALFDGLQLRSRLSGVCSNRKADRLTLSVSQLAGPSRFHQLLWEVLEDPSLWEALAKTMKVSVQRCYHLPVAFQFRARKVFTLAYIVARPGLKREKYIDHRLLSRSLVTTIDKIDRLALQVDLQAVRPGSWKALVQYLDAVRSKYGKGHVALVHFDMHGRMRKAKDGRLRYVVSNIDKQDCSSTKTHPDPPYIASVSNLWTLKPDAVI